MGNYKLLEHTADLGVTVYGKGCKELFENAAFAMYDLISDIRFIHSLVVLRVKSEGIDKDELLKNWLSELLFYFHIKDMLLSSFDVEKINDKSIISVVSGEKRDKKRHTLKHEIKAVTYHSLKIIKKDNKFQTNIIFDV
jgi:SHS2 domain-containing protein